MMMKALILTVVPVAALQMDSSHDNLHKRAIHKQGNRGNYADDKVIIDAPGDGSCMFHAVANMMSNEKRTELGVPHLDGGMELRQRYVDFVEAQILELRQSGAFMDGLNRIKPAYRALVQNPEVKEAVQAAMRDRSGFVSDMTTNVAEHRAVVRFSEQMRKRSTYSGTADVKALAHLINAEIVMYQNHQESARGTPANPSEDTVFIKYAHSHFESLCPRNDLQAARQRAGGAHQARRARNSTTARAVESYEEQLRRAMEESMRTHQEKEEQRRQQNSKSQQEQLLVGMGFAAEKAAAALQKCNNDVERAADMLAEESAKEEKLAAQREAQQRREREAAQRRQEQERREAQQRREREAAQRRRAAQEQQRRERAAQQRRQAAQEEAEFQRALEESRRSYEADQEKKRLQQQKQRQELMDLYGLNQNIADVVLQAANNDMSRATELIFSFHALDQTSQNYVLQLVGMGCNFSESCRTLERTHGDFERSVQLLTASA